MKLTRMSTRVTWRPRVNSAFLRTPTYVARFAMSNGDEAGTSREVKLSGP